MSSVHGETDQKQAGGGKGRRGMEVKGREMTKVAARRQGDVRIAAPLFIQATEGSSLVALLKEEEEKLGGIVGWRYKVVERGGTMVKQLLTRSNLFSGEPCGRSKCEACRNAEKPPNCRRRGIMYETACMECMVDGSPVARYVGESTKSRCERIKEHLDDAKRKQKDSHVYKHWMNQHGGRKLSFHSRYCLSTVPP